MAWSYLSDVDLFTRAVVMIPGLAAARNGEEMGSRMSGREHSAGRSTIPASIDISNVIAYLDSTTDYRTYITPRPIDDHPLVMTDNTACTTGGWLFLIICLVMAAAVAAAAIVIILT